MATHFEHTTLAATLTSEHTDLREVYLGRRRTDSGEDILQLVDDADDLGTNRLGTHGVAGLSEMKKGRRRG